MSAKHRFSAKDRLAAPIMLIAIFSMVFVGAVCLFLTGLFDPVEASVALSDTKPLDLPTQPPKRSGLIDWLIPSAVAETAEDGDPAKQDQDTEADEATANPADGTDLEALLSEIMAEERGESEITDADRIEVTDDLSVNENLPPEWTNLLLLATDGRDRTSKNGRTDVMIIASVNEATGEVKLSSIARDLYVPIANSTTSNRINAAFAYGGGGAQGAKLAVKTVNQAFEMNIQYYAVVNFEDMVAIVDSIGGVDIPLVGREYEYINYNVAVSEDFEGFPKSTARRRLTAEDADVVVRLDGLQALAYARIRKLDNDIQRGSRQRILLQAMMDKIMSNLTLSSISSLAMTLMPNTETNFVIHKDGMQIAVGMLWAEEVTVSELAIPIPGSYRYTKETDRNGVVMEVVSYSKQSNITALHEFIYGAYYPAESK